MQNVGHVLAAVRTDLFMTDDEFRERMDAILRMLKAAPAAPGDGSRARAWRNRAGERGPPSRAGYRARGGDRRRTCAAWRRSSACRFPPLAATLDIGVRATHDTRRRPDVQLPADSDGRALRLRHVTSLPESVRALGGRKVFVVTDSRCPRLGNRRQVTALASSTISDFEIYDRVTADSGSRARSAKRSTRSRRAAPTSSSASEAEARSTPPRRWRRLPPIPGRRSTTSGCTRSRQPAASDDRLADDRRHRQRGQPLVGLHRRRPEAEGGDRRRPDLPDGGAVRPGADVRRCRRR